MRRVPTPNLQLVETGIIDTPNTHIHDRSLGTGTPLKSGGVKLVVLTLTFSLGEMIQSFKCPHVSKLQPSHITG